jgi:hypothetical protein
MYGPVVDDEITCVIPSNAPTLVDKIEVVSYSLTRTEMNVHEGNRFVDFQWGSSKRPSFGVVSGSIAYDDCNLPRFESGPRAEASGMTITSTPPFPYDAEMKVAQGVYTVDVSSGDLGDVTAITVLVDEPYAYPYVLSFYMKPDVIGIRDALANATVFWTRRDKKTPSILVVEPVAGIAYTLSIDWLDLTQKLGTQHVSRFEPSIVKTANGVTSTIAWPTGKESDPVSYDESSEYSMSVVVTMDTGETLCVGDIPTLRSVIVSVAPWAQTQTQPEALDASRLAAAATAQRSAQTMTEATTRITDAEAQVAAATTAEEAARAVLVTATEASKQAAEARAAATSARTLTQAGVVTATANVSSATTGVALDAGSVADALSALTTANGEVSTTTAALDGAEEDARQANDAQKTADAALGQSEQTLAAAIAAEVAATEAATKAAAVAASTVLSPTATDAEKLAANTKATKLAAEQKVAEGLVATARDGLADAQKAVGDAVTKATEATEFVTECTTQNGAAKGRATSAQAAYDTAVTDETESTDQLALARAVLATAQAALSVATSTEAACSVVAASTENARVAAEGTHDDAIAKVTAAQADLADAKAALATVARDAAAATASTVQAASTWKNATELLHYAATTRTDRLYTVAAVATLTTEDGVWSYSTIRIKNTSPAYLALVARIGVSETPTTGASQPTKYADMAYQAECQRGLDREHAQLAYEYVMGVPLEYREAAYAERAWAQVGVIPNNPPAYYTLESFGGVTCAMNNGSSSVEVTDSFAEAPSGFFDARTLTDEFVTQCPTISFQPDLVDILSAPYSTATTPTAFYNAVGAAYDRSHRSKRSLPSFLPHTEGGGTFSAPRAFAVLHIDRLTNVLHASASYRLTDTSNNTFIESRYDATERVHTVTIDKRGQTQYNASVFATWSRYHAKTRDRRFVLNPVIANTLVAELRPGTYTAAQLAEEVEGSMNKALGSLDNTTRGSTDVKIRVSLHADVAPQTIEEAFELAQLKLFRAPIPDAPLYVRIATTEPYAKTAIDAALKWEMPNARPEKKTEVRLLFGTGANAHRSAHRLLGFPRSDHRKWDWLIVDPHSPVTTAEAALQAPYPYDLCDDPKMLRVTMRVNDVEVQPMYHETHAHDEGTFLLYIGSLPSVLDASRSHGVPLLRMSDYGAKVVQQQQTKQTIDRISLRFDVSYPVSASDTFTTKYNFRNQNVLFVFRLWEVVLSEKHQDNFNRSHYLTDR